MNAMAELRGAATFRTSAEAYDRHIGRYGPALARALIEAANVSAGQRALDVGCGPGALTAVLSEVLGPNRVTAVDPSDPFVEACARRRPGVDVRVGSAEALPFADHSFDVTLAQLVLNFMNDPRAGVGEMGRVTRPGGVVAAAVWDYAGEMTLLRRFWDAAVSLDPDAADRDEGRSMPYCSPEELEGSGGTRGSVNPRSQQSWSTRRTAASRIRGSRSSTARVPRPPTPPPSRPSAAPGCGMSFAAASTSAKSRSGSPPAPGAWSARRPELLSSHLGEPSALA
jgi:SAM-dependent methyltransferase